MKRVEWVDEDREGLWMIADWKDGGWEFWERDSWEVRWYRTSPTPELIAKAEEISGVAEAA